jgi:hypothetical protein
MAICLPIEAGRKYMKSQIDIRLPCGLGSQNLFNIAHSLSGIVQARYFQDSGALAACFRGESRGQEIKAS